MAKEKPLDNQKTVEDLFVHLVNVFENACDNTLDSLAKPLNGHVLQAVTNFFTADNWSFVKIESEPILHVAFQGQSGTWKCYAMTKEVPQQMMFYSLCPVHVPEDKRQPIAEFLTRANYGMILGNFELNFDNGEIRYKTSIDVTDDRLSFALIQQLVYTNVTIMDQYLPGIQTVLTGEASPAEAIRAIEEPNIGTQPDADIQPNEQI